MKENMEFIIIPYVDGKRSELNLPSDQPALAIFYVFKGQQTEDIMQLLDEHNIRVVSIPALTVPSLYTYTIPTIVKLQSVRVSLEVGGEV